VKPREAASGFNGVAMTIIALSRLMVMAEQKKRSIGIIVI
jgi:hypothetical protein